MKIAEGDRSPIAAWTSPTALAPRRHRLREDRAAENIQHSRSRSQTDVSCQQNIHSTQFNASMPSSRRCCGRTAKPPTCLSRRHADGGVVIDQPNRRSCSTCNMAFIYGLPGLHVHQPLSYTQDPSCCYRPRRRLLVPGLLRTSFPHFEISADHLDASVLNIIFDTPELAEISPLVRTRRFGTRTTLGLGRAGHWANPFDLEFLAPIIIGSKKGCRPQRFGTAPFGCFPG